MAYTLTSPHVGSVNEGESLTFRFSKGVSDPAVFTIRWVIVPKGYLPVSGDDFANFEGMRAFTVDDSTYEITIPSAENIRGGPDRSFEVEFYLVNSSDPSGNSDTKIATYEGTIEEDDAIDDIPFTFAADTNLNVIVLGSLYDSRAATGAGGDDYIIVTQYHYSDVSISDITGTNTIVFDYGVTITDVAETSVDLAAVTGLNLAQLIAFGQLPPGSTSTISYTNVVYTFVTGGTLTIASPAGNNYRFQLGNGEAMAYAQLRDVIGSPTTVAPYRETALGASPDLSSNSEITDSYTPTISTAEDILVFGGEFEYRSTTGAGGNDYFVVTPYLSADASISDISNVNTIIFDYGVTITNVAETSVDLAAVTGLNLAQLIAFGQLPPGSTSTISYTNVVYTFETGGTLTIASPAGNNYLYQLGTGEVVSYVQFREAIQVTDPNNASGPKINPTAANPFTVPLPSVGPPPLTFPDTVTDYYFRWDSDEGAFFRYTDPDGTRENSDDVRGGSITSTTEIVAGNDYIIIDERLPDSSSVNLSGADGADVYFIDKDFNGTILIADADVDTGGNTDPADDVQNVIQFQHGVRISAVTYAAPSFDIPTLTITLARDAEGATPAKALGTITIQAPAGGFNYIFDGPTADAPLAPLADLMELVDTDDLPSGIYLEIP